MGENSHHSTHLPDIQKTVDERNVAIAKVGVSNIRIPVSVLEKTGGIQSTLGTVAMYVELDATTKGTHMSRFTELLNKHTGANHTFSSSHLLPLVEDMLNVLNTNHAYLEIELEFFRDVYTPVSNIKGVAPYKAKLSVEAYVDPTQNPDVAPVLYKVFTGVEVTGKTCCPCSKEISDYDPVIDKGRGAHAQRGHVEILVENNPYKMIWFEDLVDAANKAVSQAAFPILKRADERAVTIGAYSNPKFVEDVIRDCTTQVRSMKEAGVLQFWVRVSNDESIHFHNATAELHEIL